MAGDGAGRQGAAPVEWTKCVGGCGLESGQAKQLAAGQAD